MPFPARPRSSHAFKLTLLTLQQARSTTRHRIEWGETDPFGGVIDAGAGETGVELPDWVQDCF